jgi:hypothetical protein
MEDRELRLIPSPSFVTHSEREWQRMDAVQASEEEDAPSTRAEMESDGHPA